VPYLEAELRTRLALPGIRLEGEVDHAAKCALMGGAIATLFPITWEEPFGLVMIESMLCGTPVLAFRRGAAPELVDEGLTGWLVDDADELRERLSALADGRLRFDRRRCRAVAEARFDVGRMVDGMLAVYAASVRTHGRPRAVAP
jgi:glycosyltransferase involved in cell wall biosynthesis